MTFFTGFPEVVYKYGNEKDFNRTQNLSVYVDIIDRFKDNSSLYTFYDLYDGERPDQVSQMLYNTTDYYWTFFLLNDNLKTKGWPLSNKSLTAHVKRKYNNTTLTTRNYFYDKFKVGDSITGQNSTAVGKIISTNSNLGTITVQSTPTFTPDPEYNNGAFSNVTGDGSDFFKREVTVNGVRIMAAGTVGGQTAVPDSFVEKVARMFELFLDKDAAGINESFQRAMIQTLSGDAGTYHAGLPTLQRVARGAGADYSTNFLTDAGIIFWNLTNLFDTHVQNDMVWYLNSTGSGYGDGDNDAQEVIEHVFHTLHMHGLDAQTLKLYPSISSDWNTGPLYNAMVEAYDGGFWDPSGYGGANFKTVADDFEVAAKEYLYLLNFAMFDYSDLWDGASLSPEWADSVKTPAGVQSNLTLGYALYNSYIAPVISKPSLTTIRSIFQDGNTPDQDDPTLAGASGYVVDGTSPNASFTPGETIQLVGDPSKTVTLHSTSAEYNAARYYKSGNDIVDIDPTVGPGSGLVEVTNLEHYQEENELNMRIKAFKPESIAGIFSAYKSSLRENS